MISANKPFDTNVFFSGGAGMFLQYHDIVKPVSLYAILKMILLKSSFGLPLEIIQDMSTLSLIEWYIKRRYVNPLRCLDFAKRIDPSELDKLLFDILDNDESIYRLSPTLNIRLMMSVYKKQHMRFPVYVYTEREEVHVKNDCKTLFPGINVTYFHGDLKEAISKCDQNFTYIFSDIELVKRTADILTGTCSHILLAGEYRYNYIDNCKTLKHDLTDLSRSHPFLRFGITQALNIDHLAVSLKNALTQEGSIDVASK